MTLVKGRFLFLVGLLVAVFVLVPFVSAQLESAAGEVGGFLGVLFGDQELLTKLLLSVLLFMLIYNVAGTLFKGKPILNIAASAIITIIAMYALPAGFITVIRDQYGVMGAAILSIIPFAIMLVFTVRLQNLLLGRVLWIFYTVYYFALFIYEIVAGKAWLSAAMIPYLGAIVAGIIIFFFIGAIRNAVFKGEMKELKEAGIQTAERAQLLHQLQQTELEAYKKTK